MTDNRIILFTQALTYFTRYKDLKGSTFDHIITTHNIKTHIMNDIINLFTDGIKIENAKKGQIFITIPDIITILRIFSESMGKRIGVAPFRRLIISCIELLSNSIIVS